ncbi:hypothetical protein GCM10023212_07550 [Luteolibacter yonseiensis]
MILMVLFFLAQAPAVVGQEVLTTLESLDKTMAKKGGISLSFELEGVVCGVNPRMSSLVLQDDTSTMLLELPEVPADFVPGARVRIIGRNSWVYRGTHGIHLGTAPLLGVDGLHAGIAQKAVVNLEKGRQPFLLEWFNGNGVSGFMLEIEGEGFPRAAIPKEWFKFQKPGSEEWTTGLPYRCYRGKDWERLPAFKEMEPVKTGVSQGVDPRMLLPGDGSGVAFSGMLEIPKSGNYTLYLATDDGSRLFLGKADITCRVISNGAAPPVIPVPLVESPAVESEHFWGMAEGRVTFAGLRDGFLELDLSGTVVSTQVTVLDPRNSSPQEFLDKVVKVTGLRSNAGMVALDAGSIEISPPSEHPKRIITTAAEIHQLSPKEAEQGREVRLTGVVTMSCPPNVVIQDSSGGVFVQYNNTLQFGVIPKPKEIWEVVGKTDDGDFSPMVLNAVLTFKQNAEIPKGVKPTRGQFSDGSLDAEQVEIDGIVASSSSKRIELLTQEGPVFIKHENVYPLPTNTWTSEQHSALVGSVISIRGVYTAIWDITTGLVSPSNCRLGNAVLSVTNPAPADPFAAESIRPSDLLLFNSETRAFQRVKVAGTVLFKNGTELYVNDGKSGFRIQSRNAGEVDRGDLVEAVGFPRLEAASPILVLARTRKIGAGTLPEPTVLKDDFISNPKLDSSNVTIRGTVVSDTKLENTRTLELSKKSLTFLAHVPLESNFNTLYRKGSLVEITGVYVRSSQNAIALPAEPFSVEVLDPALIHVLKNGPWWTHKHTIILIFTLFVLLLVTLVGMTFLRRTVIRRTEEIAVHLREREIIERQRVLDQERSRVAQDLHDELGAGLTEVSMLASLANNPSIDGNSKREYIDQLNGVSRSLVTGLDEIVWAVNPNYDAVGDLAGYLSLFAQQFLQLADIGCRLNIPATIPMHRLGTHERHGIFLAFKEGLNNVVKHSQASMVHLAIEVRESVLFIRIADDGQGIPQESDAPPGEGLGGMRKRITQLGGIFHIDGGTGQGTTIIFEIPLETT